MTQTFYYPSKVIFGNAAPRQIDSIADLSVDENLVLQGTVGQGKSTFLRYLCIQELTNKGSGRIPLFVELRSVTKEGLRALIYSALDRLGFQIDDELFDFYAKSGKLVLLLDAFDEIAEDLIPPTIYSIEEIAEKYEDCQIIITSRPNSTIQQSRHFTVIRLAPMTNDEHEPFLKRIGMAREDTSRLLSAIKGSASQVTNLLTTPLIMTLLATLYQADKVIPQDVPEFYERLFHTLFTRHDATKPGLVRHTKSRLSEQRLRQLFEGFCFTVFQRGNSHKLTLEELNVCVEVACKVMEITCDPAGFQHDITKIACLLQQEGDQFHFIHRSVLEFYAASFIRSLSDTLAPQVYSQLVTSTGYVAWRQVIQFLDQIDSYRFAKHFGIPSIDLFLRKLNIDPEKPTCFDAEYVAKRLFNNASLLVAVAEDGTKSAVQFGPIWTERYADEAASRLSMIVFKTVQRMIEKKAADRFHGRKTGAAARWQGVRIRYPLDKMPGQIGASGSQEGSTNRARSYS